MDGWVGGRKDGGESRVKDCLQQSKIRFRHRQGLGDRRKEGKKKEREKSIKSHK